MKSKIKTIEDLSLNAWPSHQMQIYDGWILRFFLLLYPSHKLHRTDRPLLHPPAGDKLDYCEEVYERWGTPAIYKITPLINSSFDQKLTERRYHVAHVH